MTTPTSPPATPETARLAHHFDDLEQQRSANVLGMWLFLVTEVMFFGGIVTAYIVYRARAPVAFAEASRHLDVVLGSVNTVVLLTSSFTMALAVDAAHRRRRQLLTGFLLLTIALGGAFLAIKFTEYYHKYEAGLMPLLGLEFRQTAGSEPEQLFYGLYFAMTGLHALHMVIGIVALGLMARLAWRGRFDHGNDTPVELAGLYWHFVDIVWIFLFPMLYLIDRHS